MIERILNSRGMLACLLAMATGMTLYFRMPFPDDNVFFELMYLRASPVFWGFKCTYILLLYTTPFIGYSILLSGLYIFALKIPRPPARPSADYPNPRKREGSLWSLGEIHNPRRPVPARDPRLAHHPRTRSLHRNCDLWRDWQRQNELLHVSLRRTDVAYKAHDRGKRIGGLVLEVKGDFCRKVKDILESHERGEDYIEIGLDSRVPLQPLA